jgi:co-chaperonin GroES (HSP10)
MTKEMMAVGLFVLIQPRIGQTRTRKSGLEVPAALEDRFLLGQIISASEKEGKGEFGLEAGQEVLYDKHAGQKLTVAGEDYLLITCRDVALII